MSSLLFTASLLWALENDGYGRLILLAFWDTGDGCRFSPGTGNDDLRLAVEFACVELLSMLTTSSSSSSREELFRFEREALCRLRSRCSILAWSRSHWLSYVLEGMIIVVQAHQSMNADSESQHYHRGIGLLPTNDSKVSLQL